MDKAILEEHVDKCRCANEVLSIALESRAVFSESISPGVSLSTHFASTASFCTSKILVGISWLVLAPQSQGCE